MKQYVVEHPCNPGVGYLWSASYSAGVWQVVRQKDAITLRWDVNQDGQIQPRQANC